MQEVMALGHTTNIQLTPSATFKTTTACTPNENERKKINSKFKFAFR